MADSPALNANGVLTLSITSAGNPIPDTAGVISVEIDRAVGRVCSARIVLRDGDMPDDDFPLSDLEVFVPGTAIVISAGYGGTTKPIFDGIVVRHGIKIHGNNDARLIVECKHKAVAMTIGCKNANYVQQQDSGIISQLISNAGLTADVTTTQTQHQEIVQFYSTDWDFMALRAEANGALVIADDNGTVSVKPPQTSADAVLKVTYGMDMMSFSADIDARTQLQSVVAAAWDPGTQAMVQQAAPAKALYEQGNLTPGKLAQVASPSTFRLQSTVPLISDELKSWSEARQMRAALACIRGRLSFQGNASAKPGVMIELAGVGKRFSGSVYVSAVQHRIADGNWISEVEFGLSPESHSERHGAGDVMASGLVPGVGGLQIGVVTKLDADPEGQYRIQVAVQVLEAEAAGVWARLASFYGSAGVGAFFIPEIGDEVILGYLNGDPSHPIVLGSVYSSQHKMPYELTADNYTKALWTKGLLKIIFDDDKKVITVITPQKNTIEMSDDAKSICLTDQNNNKIQMTPDGITLDSPKDIVINAKGKVSITAVSNIEQTAQADIKSEALNINSTAKVGIVAKGSATAELSASGQTTVKGALVMIN
ncbi:type VI secretion protein VgrG [Pandoraea pneumonica]|jgi:Rhs element Vgr protein|uniref:Type VI secretion protein VgrG n=1 Tax=Pandoraea pneumonica TaxID=2508299 RepID=A0A5E4S8F4_9BURK|nr:type VI secretion system tip protein VgrG [Pandoraea pneumonica]VVD71870.1 type VI secretion protein VgrG [Pandoraea pneumonica]